MSGLCKHRVEGQWWVLSADPSCAQALGSGKDLLCLRNGSQFCNWSCCKYVGMGIARDCWAVWPFKITDVILRPVGSHGGVLNKETLRSGMLCAPGWFEWISAVELRHPWLSHHLGHTVLHPPPLKWAPCLLVPHWNDHTFICRIKVQLFYLTFSKLTVPLGWQPSSWGCLSHFWGGSHSSVAISFSPALCLALSVSWLHCCLPIVARHLSIVFAPSGGWAGTEKLEVVESFQPVAVHCWCQLGYSKVPGVESISWCRTALLSFSFFSLPNIYWTGICKGLQDAYMQKRIKYGSCLKELEIFHGERGRGEIPANTLRVLSGECYTNCPHSWTTVTLTVHWLRPSTFCLSPWTIAIFISKLLATHCPITHTHLLLSIFVLHLKKKCTFFYVKLNHLPILLFTTFSKVCFTTGLHVLNNNSFNNEHLLSGCWVSGTVYYWSLYMHYFFSSQHIIHPNLQIHKLRFKMYLS